MSTFDLGHWQRLFRAAPFIADLGAELVAVQDGQIGRAHV